MLCLKRRRGEEIACCVCGIYVSCIVLLGYVYVYVCVDAYVGIDWLVGDSVLSLLPYGYVIAQ